jgi:hypothetical protein
MRDGGRQCKVKAVCGAMPRAAGCGAMPQDGDGVVIGVMKASFMSRGGCCVRQDDVVMSTATAASTARRCVVIGL